MLLVTLISVVIAESTVAAPQPLASFNPEFATPGKPFVLTVSTPPGVVTGANLREQRIALVAHGASCQATTKGIRPSSLALRQPVAATTGQASWDVVIDTVHDSDFENSYDVCYCSGFACNQFSNFQKLDQPGIITVVATEPAEETQSSLPAAATLSAAEREVAAGELAQLKGSVEKLQSDTSATDGAMQDRVEFAKMAIGQKTAGLDKNTSEVVSQIKEGVDKLSALQSGEASLEKELHNAKDAEAAVYRSEMILQVREDHAAKRARSVAERDQRFAKTLFARSQRAAAQLHNVQAAQNRDEKSIEGVSASLGWAQKQLDTKTNVEALDARIRALE